MAKVIVTPTQDWRKIAELAGGDPKLIMIDVATNELEVADVTQTALDTALAAYIADQTNIDAATAAAKVTAQRTSNKDRFDGDRVFKAFAELLIDELNALRTLHSLPDRTFAQLRTAIRAKIDAGT